MLDDTKELIQDIQGSAIPRPPINMLANIDEIMSAKITRAHATQWAQNLLYLTFDDGFEDGGARPMIDGGDNTRHGQCQRCQREERVPPIHTCSNHLCHSYNRKERESEEHKSSGSCFHVLSHSCDLCRSLLLFPSDKVTRFRLRRFRNFCDHFVSVSYCWSSEREKTGEETRYEVIEEDGTVRNTRASNHTIDRAVAFARENGFRLIWIDQECIEQADPYKKELAIQAMDHVYAMAHTTIGLFCAELEQKHLDCLSFVSQYRSSQQQIRQRGGRQAMAARRSINPNTLVEAVSLIVNDKWNARAWILQEAFASSDQMILLFPKTGHIELQDQQLICPEASLSELAVDISTLRHCLRIAGEAIRQAISPEKPATSRGRTRGERLSRRTASREGERQKPNIQSPDTAAILKRIHYFHPEKVKGSVSVWINTSKPRRTCSAATALTYLRLRDLERVADKLAIVANLCDYHIRLNTTKLDTTQQSLAVCMLALSLANGDFTLLTHQLYRGLPETSKPEYVVASESEFTWLHSFSRNLQKIDSDIWNPYGLTTGLNNKSLELSRKGLCFSGSLWNVNQFIDMTTLQTKHADAWMRLCRQDCLTSSFARSIRLATTHILFEILQNLVSMNEGQVADSIWNSVSNWTWLQQPDRQPDSMVESVKEFPPGLQVQHRGGMFSLDPSPDGRYHQCWIIDRVMEKGGFWVGNLVSATAQDHLGEISTEQGTSNRGPRTDTAPVASTGDEKNLSSHELQKEGEETSQRVLSSHLRSLGAMSMLGMLSSALEPQVPEMDGDGGLFHLTLPRILGSLATGYASIKSNEQRGQDRRAIFDVDGSPDMANLILVPFQATLESIPRTPMRSLSVSWAVEPVSKNQDAKDFHTEDNKLRVRNMVKGMWRFTSFPHGKYTIV